MSKVQILMPMGGLGSRFTAQGYTTPKPLIPVDGKPMFMKALDSFKPLGDSEHLFVLRQNQVKEYELDRQISTILPNAKISILNHDTDGAAESALIAEEHVADDLPIIIADCDIYFESTEYFEKILTSNADGILLTFNASHPRYSYVELDTSGKAVRTAEKIVISNHAILGGYYFKSGRLFKELAHEFIDNKMPDGIKEYFISHLFNLMIMRGLRVEIANVDQKDIFGTPEELNEYISRIKK